MKYKGVISIIIPIYNEESLLKKEVESLIQRLEGSYKYEIILIENGSKDRTYEIAYALSKKYKMLRVTRESNPSYGLAIKKGLKLAKYNTIVQFDLDLIDLDFFNKSIALLPDVDIVVGSKTLPSSSDKRPFLRMFVTRSLNFVLRHYFGYKGTDTHGVKVYKRQRILPLLNYVKDSHLFFDTELLLLAQKNNLLIKDLPVSIRRLRPTRFTMHLVIFQTLIEFLVLLTRRSYFIPTYKPSVTIDDYGLNKQVNKTVNLLIKKTRITMLSILPPADNKIPFYKGKIACHINLIEGKSVLKSSLIPSLVDKRGNFYPFYIFYMKLIFNQIIFTELTMEIEAQIKSILKNHTVFELNSHQHTHVLYPVDRITSLIAKKYNIARLRTYGDVLNFSLRGLILWNIFKIASFIEHISYGKILSQSPTWKKSEIPISFMSWETKIKPSEKPYEMVCHPGTKYDRNTVYTSILK